MIGWLLAFAGGVAAMAASYAHLRTGRHGIVAPALLRLIGVTAALALLFNVLIGVGRRASPLVALDVSLSWARGRDSVQFDSIVRAARAAAARGDDVLAFGDSVRALGGTPRPQDRGSSVRPVVERALVTGRPLVVVTDGELDDPDALRGLPAGSRVEVAPVAPAPDVAVTGLQAPRSAVSGDSVEIQITLATGASAPPRVQLALDLNGRALASFTVDSLTPNAERVLTRSVVLAGATGPGVLRATLGTAAGGDAVPRNDTLARAVDLAPAAAAVLVSSSPDLDTRELLVVLRGSLALPTRGYLRVAPGTWRIDGALTPVSEDEVRRALQSAPLAILHGDTALFGPPRSLTRAALLLIAPPQPDRASGEWYPTGAPASPVAAALSGIPWDSLPPLDVTDAPLQGAFEVLETRRARRLERRVAIVGREEPRRIVIAGAAGFARWRARGGAAADAFNALWGSVTDWLATGATDVRAVVPAAPLVHAGEPIRWRRGSAEDSVVRLVLTARTTAARSDTLTLSFGSAADVVESPPLAEGVYDVSSDGGPSLLVVNPSREWYARRPTVQSGSVGSASASRDAPRARTAGWLFALAIGGLCAEWIWRRRIGLR